MTATEISLNKLRTHEKVFAAGRVMQYIWGEGQIPTSPTRVRRTQSHYIQKLNSMKCVFIMFIFNHIIFLFNQRHVSS